MQSTCHALDVSETAKGKLRIVIQKRSLVMLVINYRRRKTLCIRVGGGYVILDDRYDEVDRQRSK